LKVLVVGSGAREHAIVWKLHQSPSVDELLVAPGNAGTVQIASNFPVAAEDLEGLLRLAQERSVDLTVIGPEGPLAAGIADRFQDAGLAVFGPTQAAAQIESSKTFAKELMLDIGVPTAKARTFSSFLQASEYVRDSPLPIVVKANGLTGGKGVVVTESREEAVQELREQLDAKKFGTAGATVIVEEYLAGREMSVFAFINGRHVSSLVAACDYKRVGDGDVGPNTGGMGSFTPPPFWNGDLDRQVRAEIMEPVANALADRGTPYSGALYAGIMVTEDGPKVYEFNCRLGDPETQVVIPRLKSDLAEVMMSAAQGRLADIYVDWGSQAGVGVVVASGGYPGAYEKGFPIEGLESIDGATAFHAGTKTERPGTILTDGGRVLTVVSMADSVEEARQKVYANLPNIQFTNSFYRGDIAAVA
jgi:phosphoribosylamine--glycine ligase